MNEQTRVFIVDDHPLVRESLASLIARQDDLVVCGEAASASAALAAIGAAKPDVAIVDISMDGRSGLELIRDLKMMHPKLAILVLSMHDEQVYAERALRAGARGYLMKREATKKVIEAIRRVKDGRLVVSDRMASTLTEKLVVGKTPEDIPPVARLSDRELEVFRLLGQGRGTREVAERLSLSAKTVQAYCARIKDKLGLQSSTQLLREAVRWLEEEARR